MSNRSELARRLNLELVPIENLADSSLAGRLTALGMPVISGESVAAYKQMKLDQLQQKEKRARLWREANIGKMLRSIGMFLGVCCLVAVVVLSVLQAFVPALVTGVVGVSVFVPMSVYGHRRRLGAFREIEALGRPRYAASWIRTLLAQLNHPSAIPDAPRMPSEMQDRATAVVKEIPGVQVSVDWLDTDPFLVAEHGNEEVYFGMWDEDLVL